MPLKFTGPASIGVTMSIVAQGEVRSLKEKLKRKGSSLTAAQQEVAAKEAELEAAALHVRRMAHQEQLLQEDLASNKVPFSLWLMPCCANSAAPGADAAGGFGRSTLSKAWKFSWTPYGLSRQLQQGLTR